MPTKSTNATAKKAPKTAKRSPKPVKSTGMSADHKEALATGRDEGRAVRRYLEVLEETKPRRGRRRTAESISNRIVAIDSQLAAADPLSRVHLVQERLELADELRALDAKPDVAEYEEEFVRVASSYSARKGISYAAWREVGVDAKVLKLAGVAR